MAKVIRVDNDVDVQCRMEDMGDHPGHKVQWFMFHFDQVNYDALPKTNLGQLLNMHSQILFTSYFPCIT